MAKVAAAEIKAILEEQGGSGKVWIKGWGERFGELGTLREFLDSQTSKFTVIPGDGNKFTVALARGGGGAKAKGKANRAATLALTNGSGGSKLVGEAIREIKQQLQAQGGAGHVWVDNWKERFSGLGSLRDFMENQPHKFTLVPGPGKKFIATLAGSDGAAAVATALRQIAGTGQQKRGAGWSPVVAEAIREIKSQLQEQGGSGKVFLDGWRSRFAKELGDSLRGFLASRPDKFEVIPGQGKAFTVALVGDAGARSGGGGAKRKWSQDGGDWQAKRARKDAPLDPEVLTDKAISQIVKQLEDPKNTSGNVWIKDWNRTYKDALGTLREFLESQPDKFVVSETSERKYSVSLA